MSLRNAFAHNPINPTHLIIGIGEDDNVTLMDAYITLESVTGSGELTQMKRREALEEFTRAHAEIHEHLLTVLALLNVNS